MAAAIFIKAQDDFIKHAKLTADEEDQFKLTNLDALQKVIVTLQQEQEQKRTMKYMKRLEPFLRGMEQYGTVIEVFLNTSNLVAFIWGPMKFILLTANSHTDAFNAVLDAYQSIGEQLPELGDFEVFADNDHIRELLALIYTDILEFHREALSYFRRPYWKQLFTASWRGFQRRISYFTENMSRHRHLIENRTSIMQLQEIRGLRKMTDDQLSAMAKDMAKEVDAHRERVKSWLYGFSNTAEQDIHRAARSLCPESGRWLLQNPRFQRWFNLDYCDTPLLWLTGIPGAGKSVLASVVVDELQAVPRNRDIAVAYFYCKYGDKSRNSFLAVARSILIQLLPKAPDLLSYFSEEAGMSSDSVLSSPSLAKTLLDILFSNCRRRSTIFLIIDGLDECERDDRKEIAQWFQEKSDTLPTGEREQFRCLFVSQDDGISRKWFKHIPKIAINPVDVKSDIEAFTALWHRRIEEKFGQLQSPSQHITNVVIARSQGMFLFAKLMLQHLEDQPSREGLLRELDPSRFPIALDGAYERIMQRMIEFRTEPMRNEIRKVLGWIACSPRSLRWREIQGAICIDLDAELTIADRQLLDSPKDLFAAFIEVRANGMVDLVHGTAREYLIRSAYVDIMKTHRSLALLCMGYLNMPQNSTTQTAEEIKESLSDGFYAFLDYASACWVFHLQAGIPKPTGPQAEEQELSELRETLETLADIHHSSTAKLITASKPLKQTLAKLSIGEDTPVVQAAAWAQKQLGVDNQLPCEEEALDIWEIVAAVRAILEGLHLSKGVMSSLSQFHGERWFKCDRVSCYYYHEGFSDAPERRRHCSKHEQPYLCVVQTCHHAIFGYQTKSQLNKHLFSYHGIDMLGDVEYPAFPKPPEPLRTASQSPGLSCPTCGKGFTRGHNLKSHMRSHTGEKRFKCGKCNKCFSRLSDCRRHERQHDGDKYVCCGILDDGTEWGCRAEFSRPDKREAHFRKAGQKCILPLLKEQLRKNREAGIDDADGPDELLCDGWLMLPKFNEFLRICGLESLDSLKKDNEEKI